MTVATRIITGLSALALAAVVPTTHAQAAQTTIQVNATVLKALTFTAKQDLDFGTVVMSGAPGTFTVSMSLTGVVTCPAGYTCSGTPAPAIMNVTGSNGGIVQITALPSDLVNSADGTKIRFTPLTPATITLTNSGNPGKDFNVGGSIAIPSTATGGLYTGTVEVTVDYQ